MTFIKISKGGTQEVVDDRLMAAQRGPIQVLVFERNEVGIKLSLVASYKYRWRGVLCAANLCVCCAVQ